MWTRRAFSAGLLSAAARAAQKRPNILLIVSEDNGPHFGCYGDKTVPTPHVDRLAAEGTRFDNAYVTQAVCSPSRSSILTGLYPHQNGQIGLATHAYTMVRDWPALPNLLKRAGYRTGLLGKLHVNPESAFAFDFKWRDPESISFAKRDVARTADVAREFIEAGDGPFFLMVCYADAHLPFLAQQAGLPERPLTASDVRTFPAVGCDSPRLRERVANYYNCISRLDTGIGMLLDRLHATGRADDTLIAYVGDHGAQFSRGKITSYEFALRVPLIFHWPGEVRAGRTSRGLVSTIDLMPALLEAAGAEIPELPGRSLLPLAKGGGRWRDHVVCEWNTSQPKPGAFFPQRTIRDARYKLILNLQPGQRNPTERYYTEQILVQTGSNQQEIDAAPEAVRRGYATWRNPPRLELYDLQTDPYEWTNLADRGEHAAVRERLLARLIRWQRETADPLSDPEKLARLAAEETEAGRHPQGARRPGFAWRYPEYLYAR
ncbi:MAG: sulfatase [Bryobacterales bacterium]|nr:sulfatase [Bryobacterales bacterium]